MTELEYKTEYNKILKELDNLPDHNQAEITVAAGQMKDLNADLNIGNMELDLGKENKDTIRAELLIIESLTFHQLKLTMNIEKSYTGGDSRQWEMKTRLNRMRLLLKQYTFLCRLRSDEPEAWDEINELFFDD